MANLVTPTSFQGVQRPTSFNDYQRAEEEFQARKAMALQDAMLKRQALDLQLAKANEFDIKRVGEQAYIKASQGIPLDANEDAALQFLTQKSTTFNPVTGAREERIPMPTMRGASTGQPAPQSANQYTPEQNAQLLDLFDGGEPAQPVVLSSTPTAPYLGGNKSPKSEQKLAETNIESGRKRVDELVASASSAGAAKQAANTMAALLPDMGYTGTGAGITAGIDKVLTGVGFGGVIEGKPSARETFESQGVDAWVKAVEPLKGALTEREGARFDKAVSNLTTTPEGIKARARLTEALANRAQEKANFYEQYFSQNGTLTGADRIWNDWSERNPAITDELLGVAPQIPAGAKLYGISGGKNVYKLPNGKFIMEQ